MATDEHFDSAGLAAEQPAKPGPYDRSQASRQSLGVSASAGVSPVPQRILMPAPQMLASADPVADASPAVNSTLSGPAGDGLVPASQLHLAAPDTFSPPAAEPFIASPSSGPLGLASAHVSQTTLLAANAADGGFAPDAPRRPAADAAPVAPPSDAPLLLPLINIAPEGNDGTVQLSAGRVHVFRLADFGFSDRADPSPDALQAVRITTLPESGRLDLAGDAVTAGQMVSREDIEAGLLTYVAEGSAEAPAAVSFTFQVQDDGGTAGGGVDLDPTPNTITIEIVPPQAEDQPDAVELLAVALPGEVALPVDVGAVAAVSVLPADVLPDLVTPVAVAVALVGLPVPAPTPVWKLG